jgi:hypothetical protein
MVAGGNRPIVGVGKGKTMHETNQVEFATIASCSEADTIRRR